MRLTEKEEKIARLALDKAATPGERQAAAAKLIESFCARGVTVEDIEREIVRIETRFQSTAASAASTPTSVAQKKPANPLWALLLLCGFGLWYLFSSTNYFGGNPSSHPIVSTGPRLSPQNPIRRGAIGTHDNWDDYIKHLQDKAEAESRLATPRELLSHDAPFERSYPSEYRGERPVDISR